jgi:4-carboxymuconolactone decarboxylase
VTPADSVLVDVAVALGSGDASSLEDALRAALASATRVQVDEVLLQSYLFIGFPRVLNAFRIWREVAPDTQRAAAAGDDAEWEKRGSEIFAQVYGTQHDRVLRSAESLHPDLARWMLVEGYGKVLGRPALQLQTRELCIVALLAAQEAMPQLYSHLRGALNAGAVVEDVEETLTRALARESETRRTRARDAWETVLSRRGG